MAEHVIDVDGMTLSVVDVLSTESKDNNVSPLRTTRRQNANGRQAFADGVCDIHGPAEDGSPCAKFSNLPGDGIGAYRPSILRRCRSMVVGLIKPFVLIGFVAGALFAGYSFLPNLFSLDNFVPGTPSNVVRNGGTVPNSHGNSNGNGHKSTRDGNRDSGTDTTRRTNGNRSKPTNRVGSSVRRDAGAIGVGSSWITVRV